MGGLDRSQIYCTALHPWVSKKINGVGDFHTHIDAIGIGGQGIVSVFGIRECGVRHRTVKVSIQRGGLQHVVGNRVHATRTQGSAIIVISLITNDNRVLQVGITHSHNFGTRRAVTSHSTVAHGGAIMYTDRDIRHFCVLTD